MGIKYKEDPDLIFLPFCKEADLDSLCRILTFDKDKKPRKNSEIFNHPEYKKSIGLPEKNKACWKLLAGELQHFGGDSIVNLFRGTGVLYKEILGDICDKLSVKYNQSEKTSNIENQLLDHLLRKSWDKMTDLQRRNFLRQINHEELLNKPDAIETISQLIFSSLIISRLVALFIGQIILDVLFSSTISIIGGQTLLRAIGGQVIAGPIGIAVGAAITIPSITGPAYRVTLPAAIQVSYMRRTLSERDYF